MRSIKSYEIRFEAKKAISGLIARCIPAAHTVVNNKVVFMSYFGGGYSCNPKYIAEALRKDPAGSLDLVWLCKHHDPTIPKEIRQVRYGTIAAAVELMTAKVVVDNCRTRKFISKKPNQFFIQTWHGSIPGKRIEADAESKLSKRYVRGAKRDSIEADLMIANNDFLEELMHSSFWYDGPVMRVGLPRNAPLIHPTPGLRKKVYETLGLDFEKRLCLYAPTFRKSHSTEPYQFNYDKCCSLLGERYGGEFILAMRLHPNMVEELLPNTGGATVNVTQYPDSQELLAVADVLISDYSSIAEAFALTGRPGYLYAPDVDSYVDDRGFYFSLAERAFPVAYSEDELFHLITEVPDSVFAQKREAFFSRVGMADDGYGDKDLAQVIKRVLADEDPLQGA